MNEKRPITASDVVWVIALMMLAAFFFSLWQHSLAAGAFLEMLLFAATLAAALLIENMRS